jgi:catechol 2,3-dioxygenase-like lactoylglutathione lyase family enzyme
MNTSSNISFPYTQIRIARPTQQLDRIINFYTIGLGLQVVGSFDEHEGISGVMLGLPHDTYHLEFTQHAGGAPTSPPTKDNLLVFYLPNTTIRDEIAARLHSMGYPEVAPENPYWNKHGVTIEDPDGWRIVLMEVSSFKNA